jgi:hypothetical protein
MWAESINTIKKNTEALLGTSKEIGTEVNAVETKYMVYNQKDVLNIWSEHNYIYFHTD